MTKQKFPKKREDGTFTVFVRFSSSDPETTIGGLVSDYVAAWTRANRIWIRIWRSDVIQEEHLEFSAEFSCDPRVEVGEDGHHFSIVLEGKSGANRWKDWAVLMVDDVSRVFPEAKFERFES